MASTSHVRLTGGPARPAGQTILASWPSWSACQPHVARGRHINSKIVQSAIGTAAGQTILTIRLWSKLHSADDDAVAWLTSYGC